MAVASPVLRAGCSSACGELSDPAFDQQANVEGVELDDPLAEHADLVVVQ
ncbi:MAG: hypothetical protein ACR2IP_11180 [Solirubrobacteraceae bacterium]